MSLVKNLVLYYFLVGCFQVILSEASPPGEVPFFETWMQTCMPEEGKILNPDHPCFRPDSTKVETLVALLNNSSEMKLVLVFSDEPLGFEKNRLKIK